LIETEERELSDAESTSSALGLDVEEDLKCGTIGCPSKETVWKSKARLEEHRLVKLRQMAIHLTPC
jgi:hypothetical protein